MVLKQRYRWGYRTLVAEVSDSIHLRRFCRIALSERVPDESTVRKLTRRIGPETVAELTRVLIANATREKRFRVRAVRIDSTVIEADVKYPTDSGLAAQGVRSLAREGKKLAALVGESKRRVRDRSRALGTQAARVDAHDPAAQRGGEVRGAALDRRDGHAARAVDRGEQTAGSGGAQPGTRPGRQSEAPRGGQARAAGRPLRAGRLADQAAPGGRADPGPARLAVRPGREADPQGQARQADRVRLRDPAGRADREHPAVVHAG